MLYEVNISSVYIVLNKHRKFLTKSNMTCTIGKFSEYRCPNWVTICNYIDVNKCLYTIVRAQTKL